MKIVVFMFALALMAFAQVSPSPESCAAYNMSFDASLGVCRLNIAPEHMQEAQRLDEDFRSPENQAAIAAAMNELLEANKVVQTQAVPDELFAATAANRTLVFISASMPKEVIRNYISAADSSTVLVLRGPVGRDPSKLMPTMQYITELLCGENYNELGDNSQCSTVTVNIDPPLFRKYGVTQVPTIVIETEGTTYKHVGAVPVSYVRGKI